MYSCPSHCIHWKVPALLCMGQKNPLPAAPASAGRTYSCLQPDSQTATLLPHGLPGTAQPREHSGQNPKAEDVILLPQTCYLLQSPGLPGKPNCSIPLAGMPLEFSSTIPLENLIPLYQPGVSLSPQFPRGTKIKGGGECGRIIF